MKKISFYKFKNGQEPQPRYPGGNWLSTVIFWGSIWGLAEATLGYLLHVSKIPGLAGAVMSAVAFFLLYRLYQQTGSAAAVIGASLVAAGLKSLDIVVSPVGLMDVINPVQAIIIEGLVATLALKVLNRRPVRSRLRIVISGLLFSFGSNLAYGLISFIESLAFHSGNIFQTEPVSLARFFLLSPLVTGFFVIGWLMAGKITVNNQGRKLKQVDSIRPHRLYPVADQLRKFFDRNPSRPAVSSGIFVVAVLTHLNQLWF
ncbi:MAG TPA: hypothetical protein PLB50_09350 [Candidatus Saccharicenans sp.]|nr:hypothetical protein [Candidatus Saccharicenans sp.]